MTAHYDAVLFDLDGVLTSTAALHARCWKLVFDPILEDWSRRTGRVQEPFDVDQDYVAHVDGRTRHDGVRRFLGARGVDGYDVDAVADRKQELVERALIRERVTAFPGSVRWVEHLLGEGVRTAVVSSSANCHDVLRAAQIESLFELAVDGQDVVRLGLRGKPAPDGFLEAARRLAVTPDRAAVVEDSLAGVAAGRAGAFGLVIGVARTAAPEDLRSAGADVVVGDLGELLP
jgi:alpha,alpha-trehalose phosphorylase